MTHDSSKFIKLAGNLLAIFMSAITSHNEQPQ